MEDVQLFGLVVLVCAVVGLAAIASNRLSEALQVPAPAFFLAGAALAAQLFPSLHEMPHQAVERIVTVALALILFDGGMHIGWSRFRAAAAPIGVVGVLGTFLTTGAVAALLHAGFGLDWYLSLLVGTAVAPTDPAVVFSVLGQREIAGRSGTVLEGESGANDPVGIALMAGLLAAGSLSAGAVGDIATAFVLQMAIGALVGVLGGRALLWASRHIALPNEGLYPLRTLAGAFLLFGVATVAHGSGFLAVFVAGIALGDGNAPYKREVARFHSSLASLAEIVAFITLGLTVDLGVLSRSDVWVPGLLVGAVLAVLIRPVVVRLCLTGVDLERNERLFILLAGLKGAVPVLLGSLLLAADVPQAERLYGIVVVVVVFSVVVQGGLVPTAVRVLKLPVRVVEPEPWSLGVRLRDEPQGVHQFTVESGAPAEGTRIEDLGRFGADLWVSFVVRDGKVLHTDGSSELRSGDAVLLLARPELYDELQTTFTAAR